MSSEKTRRTLRGGVIVGWYIFAIIMLLCVVGFFYLLVFENPITDYLQTNVGILVPTSDAGEFLRQVSWTVLDLIGLGGIGWWSDSSSASSLFTIAFLEEEIDIAFLIAQIAVWVVILVCIIFFIIQLVSFIRKGKGKYFIHTFFGIIATVLLLYVIAFGYHLYQFEYYDYLYTNQVAHGSYTISNLHEYFESITLLQSVDDAVAAGADQTVAWVVKIGTIVAGAFALLYALAVFYLAFYITRTSVRSGKVLETLTEEEVVEELSQEPVKEEEPAPVKEEPLKEPVKEPAPAPAPQQRQAEYYTRDEIKDLLTEIIENKKLLADPRYAFEKMSKYEFIMSLAFEELEKKYDLVDYEDARAMVEEEIAKATSDVAREMYNGVYEDLPPKEEVEPKEEQPLFRRTVRDRLSEDDVRDIIRSELIATLSEIRDAVAPTGTREEVRTVYVAPKEEVQETPMYETVTEAPVEEPSKESETIVKILYENEDGVVESVEEKPIESKEETIIIKAPASSSKPQEKRVVKEAKKTIIPQPEVRGKESVIEKGEVVKQTFEEKIVDADDEIQTAYQTLKKLLLSYGLNSRVSSSGDTFRLSKKTYCKITVSGTALKIYLALDPKDYRHSAIPINDASAKAAYQQIPLGFRVKSDLSLRRARDLVIDCMNQNGLTPHEDFVEADYVDELRQNLK